MELRHVTSLVDTVIVMRVIMANFVTRFATVIPIGQKVIVTKELLLSFFHSCLTAILLQMCPQQILRILSSFLKLKQCRLKYIITIPCYTSYMLILTHHKCDIRMVYLLDNFDHKQDSIP